MKHIFIINPVAGKGQRQQALAEEIRLTMDPAEYEIYETEGPGDATVVADARIESGRGEELRFYACGGDGTFFEVINGVKGRAPVGTFPCGSGNDLIKNVADCDFMDLDAQLNAEEVRTDLILCNGQYVANVCNLGFDADIADTATHYKTWPLVSGKAAYLFALVHCFLKTMKHPMKLWIDEDPAPVDQELIFAVMANGQFYGGSFHGAPFAEVNDGWMDLCYCANGPRLQFMTMAGAFRDGRHVTDPRFARFITYRRCRKVRIELGETTMLCLDGNCMPTDKVEAEIVPDALRLLVPRGGRLIEAVK